MPHVELTFRELLPDELQAVYPARHPLAARRRITWRDLAAGPLVLLPKQSSVRTLAHVALKTLLKLQPQRRLSKAGLITTNIKLISSTLVLLGSELVIQEISGLRILRTKL